jgi:hypothetical protein
LCHVVVLGDKLRATGGQEADRWEGGARGVWEDAIDELPPLDGEDDFVAI